ncbi:MAG: hypothetical protein V4619_04615 [Bacteroidota bacterium]
MSNRAVITIATSKQLYVDMACNLAMSFLLWNDTAAIQFLLVTDCPQFIPKKIKDRITIIEVEPGQLGEGFSSKLHMYKLSTAAQTMFIDADCLVYGNLKPAFETFKGHDVSVIGYNRTEGQNVGFCKDIATVIKNTGTTYFPLLCGSVYYFEKGDIAQKVFDTAASLLPNYHDIGLVSLRGKENEEPLIAISMAKHNQQPVNDTGLIKADRMFYNFIDTNVIEGKARLWSNGEVPIPAYSTLKLALPLIVHFNAAYAEIFEYKSEVIRLKKIFLDNSSKTVANLYAAGLAVLPGKLKSAAKGLLRPVYNLLFGYRKVKVSNRI